MTVPYHHHVEAGVRWVSAAGVMRATQATEGLFEVLWGGRLKVHPASVDGMVEGEAPGVERLTPDEGLPAGLPSATPVDRVAEDGVAFGCQMDANLMGPARSRGDLQVGVSVETLEDT